MRTLLAFIVIIVVCLIIIILRLLSKIRILTEKIKYVDEANMWHELAVKDDLTGVYNRNAYNLYINEIFKDTKNELRGIIVFDIDNFKTINDTKGHLEGDKVLKYVSKNISEVFSTPNIEFLE